MSKYVAKGAMRTVKNQIKGYSEIQTKVRSATSNDPWGPAGNLMAEIAQATYDEGSFIEIMSIVDKRLNDHGKNWRHVFKSLTLLDYLVHCGSEQVVKYAKENLHIVKTLREFQHIDDQGRDQGANVRQKAKILTALLNDDERLRQERKQRNHMHNRLGGNYTADDNSLTVGTSRSQPLERSRSAQDIGYDDESELQRAIEESKRTAAEELRRRGRSEEDLRKALAASKSEAIEKQQMVAAQNEMILTEDMSRLQEPWQRSQGISSSAMELFGGSIDEQSISTPNEYPNGFERSYTITTTTTTVGANNPFGSFSQPADNFQQQQQQQQQLMSQQPMLAIQGPGSGAFGGASSNYAQSDYGGSTISSNMDGYTSISGRIAPSTVPTSAGAMVPFGSNVPSAPVSSGSGANPFFQNGPSNSMGGMNNNMSAMSGQGGMSGSSTMPLSSNYSTPYSSYSANTIPNTGGNSGYNQGFYGQTPTAGTNAVGTLIDIGAPSSNQSFGQQPSKNPFQQPQAPHGQGSGFDYNRSWS